MVSQEIIKEIILENRTEVMRHHVIPRNVRLDEFDRQVLVGIRRAGKSYILYGRIQELIREGYTWDDMVYINFEDERLSDMKIEDLNAILEVQGQLSVKRPMLFLDEIQNIEGWDKFARRLADNKYKVVITGSNAKMLSKDVETTLGGRYMTREVFPFSFDEYLTANSVDASDGNLTATTTGRSTLKRHYEEYFRFGAFPECATMPVKRDYLMSLYQKVYLGDIAARHGIENIFALRVLFRKLAESVKQPVSFTRAANIVASTGTKIAKGTVINYLEYAKEAYLILPLSNIADNLAGKITSPKYYFIDNGIISVLALDVRTSLLENLVAMTLLRHYGTKDKVYYYNHGVEVDFYVPDEETAFQSCYAMDNTDGTFEREVGALLKMQKHLSCRRRIIVTYDSEDVFVKEGVKIEVMPAWKFIREW